MRWFRSKLKRYKDRRDTRIGISSTAIRRTSGCGKLNNGRWEVRQATEEEMQEFLASEAAFVTRATPTAPAC